VVAVSLKITKGKYLVRYIGDRVGDTGLKIEAGDRGVNLRIEAAGISRSFEVGDAGFKKPKGGIVNLEIPLKSGDVIGFRLTLGDDGKSVKIIPEVAWGKGNYDEINWLEYKPEVEVYDPSDRTPDIMLKDVFFIRNKDEEGVHLTVLGINEQYPRDALYKPPHFIAMYYERVRFEAMGGKITNMEFYIGNARFDYEGELRGQRILIEVKHGYEKDPSDLIRQADEYLSVARNENAILMYRFCDEPQSEGAKALFQYLKDLRKSNKDVVWIFVKGVEWEG